MNFSVKIYLFLEDNYLSMKNNQSKLILDEMPECHDVIDGICNIKIDKNTDTMDSAKKECTKFNGYLPRLTSAQDWDLLEKWVIEDFGWHVYSVFNVPLWVSLTTDISP